MSYLTNNQSGFTLIELALYSVITALILISVTTMFNVMVSAQVKSQSINEVNQQGTAAMDMITQTIRTASSVTSPAAGVTAAQTTVAVPTAALSPTIIDVSGSNALEIKEGTGAAVPLTNSLVTVSSFSVQNLSGAGAKGDLRISFTLSRVNNSGRNEYTYQKTFVSSAGLH